MFNQASDELRDLPSTTGSLPAWWQFGRRRRQQRAKTEARARHRGEPPYLHDLAIARHDKEADAGPGQRYEECFAAFREKFYAIHFVCFSDCTTAAIAEVTPARPPYDYPSQKHWRILPHSSEQKWNAWREVVVNMPPHEEFAQRNAELSALAALYLRASHFTDPEDSAFCHRLVRLALQQCIRSYDDEASEPSVVGGMLKRDPEPTDMVAATRQLHKDAEGVYHRCAQRRTVSHYVFGMLLGVGALAVMIAVNLVAFKGLENQNVKLPTDMEGLVTLGHLLGAAGAVSSVLLRITSSKVDMDVESTRHGWRIWSNPAMQRGLMRVVIGSLFGGVAAWFMRAGLLGPDALQAGTDNSVAIAGVIAYAAGFSERFIPDIVLRQAPKRSEG
ncbi:hypothetical protein [Kribbella sp. CA-247076]|uniref:hypothetical protein n=1 Tax=Kribbella sp. CA-247076 TaxID=3239941 RepID=UPI003D8C4E1B